MSTPIESHAFLSNCRTAALVTKDGTIDWLCLPRLDSGSVFGELLGDAEDGRWQIRPTGDDAMATRTYEKDTFVLNTRWETADGTAQVQDFMPVGPDTHTALERTDIVRRLIGVAGTVTFEVDLRMRFDYARAMPWVRSAQTDDGWQLTAMAGPDAMVFRGPQLQPDAYCHRGTIQVAAGEVVDLTLTWFPSYRPTPDRLEIDHALDETRDWWQSWADQIDTRSDYRQHVIRSLLVLRALTNHETGGIAAAATTSLPEDFGGERNWDYRFVWLRDAALTLEALLAHGFLNLAENWRTWLLRAVAGDPADLQIMYGLAGERDLFERELDHLAGFADSKPVRIGNGAATQYQADVVGEVLVTLSAAREAGLADSDYSWPLEKHLIKYAAEQLDRPDNGMWEIRGASRMFTHSRVMIWAVFDRAVRAVEQYGLDGPVYEWRKIRDRMRAEIDDVGVSKAGHFTQFTGTEEVDASLLLLPQVGYCAADDPRMLQTVERIEQTLLRKGLVMRYRTDSGVDGLAGGEHPFLACSFWLVEQYAATGRVAEARVLMDRLCSFTNDVGLLSEEYDPLKHRQVGNFPQAFSHLALVRAADALAGIGKQPR